MQRAALEAQSSLPSLEKKAEGVKIGQLGKASEKNEGRRSQINDKIRYGRKEGEQVAEGQEENKKTPLYFFDQASGQWFIHPHFQQFFLMQLESISEMNKTVNPKWSEHQAGEYFRFLKDLQTYITDFIFQFQIPTFQDFFMWLQAVKPYNPVGYELYERQLDYIQKNSERYNSRPYRGKEQDSKPAKEQKKEYKPAQLSHKYSQKPHKAQPNPKRQKKRYVQKSTL